jgi:hypothetical protein
MLASMSTLDVYARCLGRSLGGNQALLLEVLDDLGDGAGHIDLVRLDVDLWLGGSLVGGRDTGEL